ncbi:MAG: hypothetical protein IT572_05785 [Deltaproteobacteria bacterium]|nr:hypothetical protein [Deltaproteobacteria bacterium]
MVEEAASPKPTSDATSQKPKVDHAKLRPRTPRGGLGCLPWMAGAAMLAAIVFLLYERFRNAEEPPPPPKKTYTVAAADFYLAYLESVELVAKGKSLFHQGRRRLGENPETLPESLPATPGGGENTPAFRAAERFALALEQIDHAEELLKTDTMGLKPHERDCRDLLLENLDKYRGAVKIFNEYAKAQYQGSEAKAEKFALSDGMAKWEMAETLMSKHLEEGCRGEFFIYVQDQKHEFRRRAFEAYRSFYGDGFEEKSTVFSLLMRYQGAVEPLPSPSAVSPPTKVFLRSPE